MGVLVEMFVGVLVEMLVRVLAFWYADRNLVTHSSATSGVGPWMMAVHSEGLYTTPLMSPSGSFSNR